MINEWREGWFIWWNSYLGEKLINIVIPNSRLSWSNIEHIAGVFLQGKTFEVLKLKGQLSHNWEPNKDKHGTWNMDKAKRRFSIYWT